MTPSEERALSALITSKNKKEAAQKARITERTLRRYFESPEFCKRYREAFAQVVQDATRQAQQLLAPALSTLESVMADEDIPTVARVNAAKIALDYAVRLTDQNDLAERLTALEELRGDFTWNPRAAHSGPGTGRETAPGQHGRHRQHSHYSGYSALLPAFA